MKIKFLIYIFLIFLISCETTDIVEINAIDPESMKQIEEVELLLLNYKFNNNKDDLKKANDLIKILYDKSTNNKYFEAKVLGLKGEYELVQNNKLGVKNIIEEIESKNKYEEKLYILKASIENDIIKKEDILKLGIEKANTNDKIKIYLADLYFLKGDYTQSSSMYDDVFVNIPESFKKFYENRRSLSLRFQKNPPKNPKSILSIEKDKVTLRDVFMITNMETEFLKDFENLKDVELINRLQANKFIFSNTSRLNDFIKKSDIAFFLIKILSIVDKDESLLIKYSKKINSTDISRDKESDDLSPIPDIKTSDYFYTAVLVLVEREIMELPDGINFFPNEYMSGLDYYLSLKKCK